MKTIGIIGGMGPEATADLFLKILNETDAACDQAHVPVLIDSNTAIADRTGAILSDGKDPLPEMIRSATRLEQAGADLLLMACNTAHYFYERITPHVSIPFLHMPRETAREAALRGYRRVALLATDGTVQTGVYRDAFRLVAPEIELLLPDEGGQAALMDLIYGTVKAGRWERPVHGVAHALAALKARGAESFVLGCTELPLAFQRFRFDAVTLDPTRVLARAAVAAAGAPLKQETIHEEM